MRNFVPKQVLVLLFSTLCLFGAVLFFPPQSVYAYECVEIEQTRIFKIGGFATEEELREAFVLIHSTANPGCGIGINWGAGQKIPLSGAQVALDDDGTYYTQVNLANPSSSMPDSCFPLNIRVLKDPNNILSSNYCEFDLEDPGKVVVPFTLCNSVPAGEKRDECEACIGKNLNKEDAKKIWTALGCITVDESKGKYGAGIITALIRIGLGIAGGALLLMILAAAFLLSTSGGDPKKTEEAQQMITSGVVGLLFIIFSVVILRTIGIDILQIPGF